MKLSGWAYFSDFIIYPLAAMALAVAGFWVAEYPSAWPLTFFAGLGAWTLIEYLLHRFVFHHIPWIEQMHDDHHVDPRALIGSPFGISLGLFLLALALLWLCLGLSVASGLAAGLMIGYVWYGLVHHAVHHWAIDERSWLYDARVRHLLHHYRSDKRSFGVTTGFWDHVFGTAQTPRRAKSQFPILDRPPH